MKINNKNAIVFVPDGTEEGEALNRTAQLAVAAHADDIELMAYQGIAACFGKTDKWFTGVVTTDGAGSPRNGIYAQCTDEEMKKIRIEEQKKAAIIGEYSALLMLGYTSNQVKDSSNIDVVNDYVRLLKATRPEIVYTHNLADKHDTHCGVAVKLIKAIRSLPKSERPKKLYGCEVWRDLDWVSDTQKVIFDTSAYPDIAAGVINVFDSQIAGGKRYDLAVQGRRRANATYAASHGCDEMTSAAYAMDLTPLIECDEISVTRYVGAFIDDFRKDVEDRLNKLLR